MATCELVIELFTRLVAGIVFAVNDAPDEMIGILNVLVPVQILFNNNKDEPLIDFTYATFANSLLFKPVLAPNVVVGNEPLNVAVPVHAKEVKLTVFKFILVDVMLHAVELIENKLTGVAPL